MKEKEEVRNEYNLLVKMNTKSQQNPLIWRKKYVELVEKYKTKENEYKNLINQKEERKLKESNINSFIETLKKGEILFEWDDAIFNFTLEKAIVHKDKTITFKFYTGFETTLRLRSNSLVFLNCKCNNYSILPLLMLIYSRG